MAIRNILKSDEPALYKKSRQVTEYNDRIHTLLDDLKDTLENAGGVGLAAPQVGVLRRAVIVLDTSDPENEKIIELINPEIIECSGEQCGPEGCLSVPEEFGIVRRPMNVKVRANDRFGTEITVEGTGLTARAFCHEIDHLNGIIFKELAERMLAPDELISGDVSSDEEEI